MLGQAHWISTAANDQSRQLVADRAELGTVSAQIIDFEKARIRRDSRARVEAMAADGMAEIRARFQQQQDFNARVDAERKRMADEQNRIAQERAALERQEKARNALKQIKNDQLSRNDGHTKP